MSTLSFCTLLGNLSLRQTCSNSWYSCWALCSMICVRVPFLSFTSECVNVIFIYVGKIVLRKLKVRLNWSIEETFIWVCLKMVYTPNYSHLVGIMISKTIGFRGTQHFQTNLHLQSWGICPSRNIRRGSSVGVIELVAGTIAPPFPDMSPGVLSMALETTADNLYFQVSAGVMPITPQVDW